jgi:hypothetical protein
MSRNRGWRAAFGAEFARLSGAGWAFEIASFASGDGDRLWAVDGSRPGRSVRTGESADRRGAWAEALRLATEADGRGP